jgi:hypothetical protein
VSRTFQSAFLLALLAVVAAGCASGPSSAGASPNAGAAPSSPATINPAPAAALPLTFSRTGGFAGVDDQLTIAADGTVTVKRGSAAAPSTSLGAAKLAELNRLLADPALTGPTSPPAGRVVCSDGFVYRFRTPGWTLVTDDCAGHNQPAVQRVLQFLTPLI